MNIRVILCGLLLALNFGCGGGTIGTGVGVPPVARFSDGVVRPGEFSTGVYQTTAAMAFSRGCYRYVYPGACRARIKFLHFRMTPQGIPFELMGKSCRTGEWRSFGSRYSNVRGFAEIDLATLSQERLCRLRVLSQGRRLERQVPRFYSGVSAP